MGFASEDAPDARLGLLLGTGVEAGVDADVEVVAGLDVEVDVFDMDHARWGCP